MEVAFLPCLKTWVSCDRCNEQKVRENEQKEIEKNKEKALRYARSLLTYEDELPSPETETQIFKLPQK